MSPPPSIRRIVLTGFMGAGKSTIGPLLATNLGWEFLDADTAIESRTGMIVADIFAQQGEAAFRALEAEVIRENAPRQNLVFALGGGAVEAQSTREFLATLDDICIVFLDAPLDILVARCIAQPGAAERPVLADRERLLERFNSRLPLYRDAHLTVTTAGLTPQAVAESILKALDQRCILGSTAEGIRSR